MTKTAKDDLGFGKAVELEPQSDLDEMREAFAASLDAVYEALLARVKTSGKKGRTMWIVIPTTKGWALHPPIEVDWIDPASSLDGTHPEAYKVKVARVAADCDVKRARCVSGKGWPVPWVANVPLPNTVRMMEGDSLECTLAVQSVVSYMQSQL